MNLAQYICTLLAEECNEVGQRASKATRFGLEEVQEGQSFTNYARICFEINDLNVVTELLHSLALGKASRIFFNNSEINKCLKILKYTRLSISQKQLPENIYPQLFNLMMLNPSFYKVCIENDIGVETKCLDLSI